jgi:alkanesulfonate monooxygenase SsuD/methylene tetrahydromethanopterin reductase-like flavin-dependent oxidoreductase (luciferase family)
VWVGEHHMNGREEVLPTPEMLIAKAAGKTSRIRMGPGVRLIPLHYPLDVAAEAATADHLTDGRYMFGFGTGGGQEYAFYGLNSAEGHARAEEAIDIIQLAWQSEGPFSYEGQFWQMKDVYIWPRPLQDRLPVARACNNAESCSSTGKRGFSLLTSQFQPSWTVGAAWDEYARGAGDAGRAVNRSTLALSRFCWVDETDAIARDKVRAYQNHWLDYVRSLPTRRQLIPFLPSPDADVATVDFERMIEKGQYLVGSAETVAAGLRQLYADSGGFGILLLLGGRDPAPIRERLAMYERFARDVAPAIADLGC